MIHKHTAQRRMFQVLVMVAIIALSVNSLTFLRSFDLTSARAQSQDPQVKPVVVYPEAFADSLPASEVPPDLIKNGERKPISPPPLAGPNTSVDGAQESAAAPTTDEYEFPMLPLPKGETSAAASAAPDQGPSLAPDGAAALNGALPANAPQALNMPVALLSFPGNSFQDNLNAGFGNLSPPDTNGDVGPNHYVQMTNLLVRVWDKAGNPLTAPFKLSSLFTPLGGQCAAPDAGDPIVLYDPLADRWLLSQFAFASISSPPYHECIAVSKTGDPTGAYYLYDFVTPGNEFPDYPKLGVWPDAYYMTTNQFLLGGSFDGAGAFAFDRSKMLVGDPSASVIYFNLNLASHPEAIGGMLPSDFDGLIAPPAGRPNTFAYFLATEFGDAIDGLRLFNFHVDFATPLNSTFTERPESPLPVAAFNPISPSGRNDIQQPPPATNSNALDSISDRLMHRLQYRNFGSYESLVTNHTVNISGGTTTSTYRAGVRYYQLTGNGAAFSVAEQATYGPADGNSRWMGSAATDNQGNLAVGFSVSSLTTFPSIHYAGRLASDPPGGLFQGEQSIVDGTGVQRSTGGRWGDYSGLTVDPADDCTFWITNEYYTAASQAASTVGWLTQIGAFRFPACTPAAQGTLQGTVIDAGSNAPVSGALIQVSNGFSASTSAAGAYTRNLAPGTYTATASKFGYQPASATVTIANGAVTVQDFALIPLPVMAADSSAVIGESFPPNGAIDPAE
ncbi:MAG TPA: carboxypeptidase-like regulatory domain-containing protein, partial [Anaerolineales bacterium]